MNKRTKKNNNQDTRKNNHRGANADNVDVTSNHSNKNEEGFETVSDQKDTGYTPQSAKTADQKKSAASDQEISHFLKAEVNQELPENKKKLDSASVVHGVGHMLRNARLAKEMSLGDVSRQLKISVQQVEAIEKEDFDELPGQTFVRGFVRNYANLMQLDADPIVQLLPGSATSAPQVKHTPFKTQELTSSSRDSKHYSFGLLFVIIILVCLGWGGYFLYERMFVLQKTNPSPDDIVLQQDDGQRSVELLLPLSSPSSEPGDNTRSSKERFDSSKDSALATNAIGTLTFKFSANAHVMVTDGNDDIIFKQNNIRGTQQRVSGKKPLSIVISDASAVKVTYNNRLIDTEPYIDAQSGSAQFILK